MAEILENNIDNFYLEKDPSLCLPNDIFEMVNKQLVVKKIINNHLLGKKEL